jgi:hypothetical protein
MIDYAIKTHRKKSFKDEINNHYVFIYKIQDKEHFKKPNKVMSFLKDSKSIYLKIHFQS